MAAYRPKSLDDLNNQYDKVKSAEQAIKQGKSRLDADNTAGQGTQRVTWNYDPAKYRVSKEEAAALTGSVDRFIKEFSTRQKPQASALELAREALETTEQTPPELQQETAAAFDALLERAKAETAHAVEQAQQSAAEPQAVPEAHHAAASAEPLADEPQTAEGAMHHGVYQSAGAPVKEGELSGLMDEYMRVMNDEEENERGGRFRRRRKERKHGKHAVAQPVPQPPVMPLNTAPEAELPQDFLAPETDFEIPEEVVAPVEDAFDVPEEVVAPVEDAFDVPDEVVAPVEDEFDVPDEIVASVEDAFDVPDEVVAPVEDEFDIPDEVVAPVEDAFDVPDEIVAPVEDEFDIPDEVAAPVEDEFDVPDEIVAPVEDAFDVPDEVVAPVEDAFDVPEEVVAPVEDAFDVPDEIVAPVEDAFDVPDEVVAPVEDEFDIPNEAVIPAEGTEEAPQEEDVAPAAELFAPEETGETEPEPEFDDFVFPEEFLMPVFEPEEAAELPAAETPVQALPEEAAEEVVIPVEEPAEAFEAPADPAEEYAQDAEPDAAPAEESVQDALLPPEAPAAKPDLPGSDAPQETDAAAAEPEMVELPEADDVFGEAAAYPTQFEDVASYSANVDPEDRFVPADDFSQQETDAPANAPEDAPALVLDLEPETAEAPQEAPAEPQRQKKEHRFLRGLGKFFCSIFLIVSLLTTACVALLGTVLGINSGTPTIGDYYLFTASNTYEGTAVEKGDLVLCQKTNVIPNDSGVVYIDSQSHSFSFGVKRSDRFDSAQNTLIYNVSGVTVTKENLLGTVVQTLPQIGIYVRYIIDHFVPLICGCAALDVLWILLLILLFHRRRDADEEDAEPSFVLENAAQNDVQSIE